MFHEFFHIPQDTSGHVGTARNATGHDVIDVAEFPEWCRGLGAMRLGYLADDRLAN
jgi:hypothetical protein